VTTDLRDLALLVAVVDTGSITAGADLRGMSLSAASTRISRMERQRKLRLLDRNRRGVTATPAGQVMVEQARRIIAETQELDRRMTAYGNGLRHEIRLATNSSAVDTLTEFLAATLTRLPDISVIIRETTSSDAVGLVDAGTVDLAVISDAVTADHLDVEPLWDDTLVVIGAGSRTPGPRSPQVDGDATFRNLLDRPLVGLTSTSPLQQLIEDRATELGVTPSYRVRLPSLAALCAVAATGAGPAVVPRASARRAGLGNARELPDPWAHRRAVLVTRDRSALSGAAADFCGALLAYRSEVL
jgi:molybdate transport repressor ModE-like protein